MCKGREWGQARLRDDFLSVCVLFIDDFVEYLLETEMHAPEIDNVGIGTLIFVDDITLTWVLAVEESTKYKGITLVWQRGLLGASGGNQSTFNMLVTSTLLTSY